MPRALQHIFSHIEEDSDAQYAVRVSYFEIYEGHGYDLLSRTTSEPVDLSKFPQVSLHENERGEFVCGANLKRVYVPDLNAALNQLFIGDTNRIMCQTPSNDQSTRSHCIFTIYVDAKETNSDICRSSKFNMVDLAGSERISKTHVTGKLFDEARHINSSLHFLERVIVALFEKRDHVPYRDSLLTKYLKDSLGGNCKTTMLATLSMAGQHLDESVATCRFAQRVGSISNKAFVNKEVDPKRMIKRLEKQVEQLKGEIAYLQDDDENAVEISEEEQELASGEFQRFFSSLGETPQSDESKKFSKLCRQLTKANSITRCFRTVLLDQSNADKTLKSSSSIGQAGGSHVSRAEESQPPVSRITGELKSSPKRVNVELSSAQKDRYESDIDALLEIVRCQSQGQNPLSSERCRAVAAEYEILSLFEDADAGGSSNAHNQPSREMLAAQTDTAERQKAYDEYKLDSAVFQKVEEQKAELKETFSRAKSVAERLNKARAEVQDNKALLEQTRVETALEKLTNATDPNKEKVAELDAKFTEYQNRLIPAARDVKQFTLELKDLKEALQYQKHNMRKLRRQLSDDFEEFLVEWIQRVHGNQSGGS